jgi:hypothetical protein
MGYKNFRQFSRDLKFISVCLGISGICSIVVGFSKTRKKLDDTIINNDL